jgi:hypothetical protein
MAEQATKALAETIKDFITFTVNALPHKVGNGIL